MAHTLSGNQVLDASVDELWHACKHSHTIMCDLLPEYFAKAEYVEGQGEPGSIRVITMGPGKCIIAMLCHQYFVMNFFYVSSE